MAYIDYSSQFVLDQFFTYINALQLGSNDKHIVDNFSVEHNWNTATADGTHKWSAMTVKTTGSQALAGYSTFIPTAGLYQIVRYGLDLRLEIYVSGSWEAGSLGLDGLYFFDGTNMRISNSLSPAVIFYYQKF